MKKLIACSLSVMAVAVARADAAYGDGDGVLTYKPGAGANAWSDSGKWYYSATDDAAGKTPGPTDDVVLTVPISAENPLTFPSDGAVSVNHFDIGCPRKGTPGDWHLLFPSGSDLTISGESVWARNAGTVVGTIESGAKLTAQGQLVLGRTANSSAIITNRGEIVANGALVLGGYNGALGQIDLFGSLTVKDRFVLGNVQSSIGRLVVHEGATLSKPSTSEYNYVGIGENAIGELVLEEVYSPCGGESVRLGVGDSGYSGTLVMRGKGGIGASSGSGNILAGCGKNSYGEIRMSGLSAINGTSGMHFYIGYGEHSHAVLTMSDSAYVKGVGDRDPHFAFGKGARTDVSMSGAAYVQAGSNFYIAEGVASTAEVSVAGSSSLQTGMYFYIGQGKDSVSKVTVTGSDAYLKSGRSLSVATGEGATGVLRLEGGYLSLRPYAVANAYETLVLGSASSCARFEGWGTIASHTTSPKADQNPFGVFLDGGQVIADGAGEDRDLCLNNLTDVGRSAEEGNASGSNGWYAVNHGRVIYPHARALAKDGSFCVGDYYTKTTPDLVNACAVTLTGNGSGSYLHAALYAPDRTDVPAGIVCGKKDKVLGIWRMGYCTGESGPTPGAAKTFTSASLTFRYDALAAGKGSKYAERYVIETYRYDGSAWQKVAEQENDTDNALVTLTGITPYTDTVVPGYNIGWTAIVARYQAPGLAIIFK